MNRINLLLCIIVLCFFACSQKRSNEISSLIIEGKPVLQIDVKKVKDSIPKKLSDFVTDIKYVKLETNENCLIPAFAMWMAGKKYILVNVPRNGVYQFSLDGKFIRKVIKVGNGPREVKYPILYMSNCGNYLHYIERSGKNTIHGINLNTAEFLDDIPLLKRGVIRDLVILNDTVSIAPLLGASTGGLDKYYIFRQTKQADALNSIPCTIKNLISNDDGKDMLYEVGHKLHYRPVGNDTIFEVDKKSLKPKIIINSGNKNKTIQRDVGYNSITIIHESKELLLLRIYTIEKVEIYEMSGGTGSRSYGKNRILYFDKKNKVASYLKNFKNDLAGIDFNPYYHRMQDNGMFCSVYQSVDLIENAENIKSDPDIRNKEKLLNIISELKENDNPVLIIGKIK